MWITNLFFIDLGSPVSVGNCRTLSSEHGELAISRLVTRRRHVFIVAASPAFASGIGLCRRVPAAPVKTSCHMLSAKALVATISVWLHWFLWCCLADVILDDGQFFSLGLAGRIPKFSGLAFFCNLSMSIVDGNRWNIFHMRTPKYIKRVSPRCSRWSFTNFQAGSLCIYFGVSIVQYEPSWCMISLGRFGHA